MSTFWQCYANTSDDLRHKIIEEGWFGRQVTPNINAGDMPALAPSPAQATPANQSNIYSAWGASAQPGSPHVGKDIHGNPIDRGIHGVGPSDPKPTLHGPEPGL